jgi:hypothetical protein
LVRRDFLDVLGDLNTVVSILAVWIFLAFDPWNKTTVRFMYSMKLFMGYYGQFSHRSAHTASSVNNKFVQTLRSVGVMIPLDTHRSHHRPPHDREFCLIGICDPLVNFLYSKVTRNRWFWMFGFFGIALYGVLLEATVMDYVFRAIGLEQ